MAERSAAFGFIVSVSENCGHYSHEDAEPDESLTEPVERFAS